MKYSILFSALLVLSACGGDPASTSTHEEGAAHADGHDHEKGEALYACPMHPEITSHEPGESCSKCGMTLEKKGGMKGMKGMDHEDADGHPDGGSHMGHMEDVKSKLMAKLGDAYDKPIAGLAEADAKAGAEIYAKTCSLCHGEKGKGDGPASAGLSPKVPDHTDYGHASYYSDAGRMEILTNGIEGSPMAGFGGALSEQDRLNLYAFVVSLRGEAPAEGAAGDGHGDHDH